MRRPKKRRNRLQSGEWGVVETRSALQFGHSSPVWIAYWIDLAAGGQMSVKLAFGRATPSDDPGAVRTASHPA